MCQENEVERSVQTCFVHHEAAIGFVDQAKASNHLELHW
jgi:hypothetical protein